MLLSNIYENYNKMKKEDVGEAPEEILYHLYIMFLSWVISRIAITEKHDWDDVWMKVKKEVHSKKIFLGVPSIHRTPAGKYDD